MKVEHLSVGYDEDPDILSDISFDVYPKDFIGIHGPNGGGKTTLVRAILGLIKPRSGQILFYDEQERAKTKTPSIGYVRQLNQIDRSFPISAQEVVESGIENNSIESKIAISEVLELVGMADHARKPIGRLSGGQLQRVLLARALVRNPSLLILDEPTTYVDALFEKQLYSLLQKLAQQMTILLVSHDLETITELSSRLIYVNRTLQEHSISE